MKKIHQETTELNNKTLIKRYYYDYQNDKTVIIKESVKVCEKEKGICEIRIPLKISSKMIKRIVAGLNE